MSTASTNPPREVVLVTGTSGSGKSVALHALEDSGFFCVDNLPPELLRGFLALDAERFGQRVAIAIDARSASSLPQLLPLLDELNDEGVQVRTFFLDSTTDALVRRFSESRRPHPLSSMTEGSSGDSHRVLVDAIELERELLSALRERATVIDTSQMRPVQLRQWMRTLVRSTGSRLILVFESFAFKHGVPLDADFVFDVRILPNPHYVPELKALTGRDAGVIDFLSREGDVAAMQAQIEGLVRRWLPAFEEDQRSYLTVAIGCTGGQHRSVYLVEQLAQRFAGEVTTLRRHRELDDR
jgi:RNase adapter protein RapZ